MSLHELEGVHNPQPVLGWMSEWVNSSLSPVETGIFEKHKWTETEDTDAVMWKRNTQED